MRVEGIDLSGSMIEVARRTCPAIRFTRNDIRNSHYRPGHFDAIWAGYSLFHMGRENFQAVLKRIRKALVLVCLYSIKELTALLSTEGFNVIAQKQREPVSELEYPYQKLLLVSLKED